MTEEQTDWRYIARTRNWIIKVAERRAEQAEDDLAAAEARIFELEAELYGMEDET